MPVRVQRKRSKGSRMADGAVYVGRPTFYGNPFDLETFGRPLSLKLFANTARGVWQPQLLKNHSDEIVTAAYHAHLNWLERIGNKPQEDIRAFLRGKNLACWCGPEQACHADILLEIAND
jgi:hypothetical protein